MDTRAEGSGLNPSPVFGPGGITSEDIGSNLCNLVHFGVKNKHFKQKHSNVHQFLISKLSLITDFGQVSCYRHDWRPVHEKVYNSVLNLDFV